MNKVKSTIKHQIATIEVYADGKNEPVKAEETFSTRCSRKSIIVSLFNKYNENFRILKIETVNELYEMEMDEFLKHAKKVPMDQDDSAENETEVDATKKIKKVKEK